MNSTEIGTQAFQKVLGASDKAHYFLNQFNLKNQPFEILDIILVDLCFGGASRCYSSCFSAGASGRSGETWSD